MRFPAFLVAALTALGALPVAAQGVVPTLSFVSGQYKATLPTFTDAQVGYLSVDQSGRLILAPTSSVLADLRVSGSPVASGNPVPVSGTLAATQSGAWNVGLNAGGNVIGKVGIDQTTPGTTNVVSAQGQYIAPPTLTIGQYSPLILDGAARLVITNQQTLAAAGNSSPVANGVQGVTNGLGFQIAPSTNAGNAIVPVAPTASAFTFKASAANLFGFSLTQGATAGYFVLLNLAAAPASGAAISPIECIPVTANGYAFRRQMIADRYSAGLTIVSSSSCTTYTPIAPVVMSAVVQ